MPANTIWALWDDLDMDTATCGPNCGVYTSTSGVAPNRIFNVEWRACVKADGACVGNVDFEVRLYEGQTRFDVIYGSVAADVNNAAIGVRGSIANTSTFYACDASNVTSNLQLSFTLQSCNRGWPISTPPAISRTR